MFLTLPPSQSVFAPVSARKREVKAASQTDVCYVGLGDQFDDDRRLVRWPSPSAYTERSDAH